MLLGKNVKVPTATWNYKGNKTAQHLLLDTIAVDLLLCSISDTIRSWQSLCCCCQKVQMATRKPHQPSVAYSWEPGCNNKFMLIVSFGPHDQSARLGWGFWSVFTDKTKTDIIKVLTKRYSFTEKKPILILLKHPYIASTSLIVVSGDHVEKGFPLYFVVLHWANVIYYWTLICFEFGVPHFIIRHEIVQQDLIEFTFSCQPTHICTTVSKKMYLFFTHLQCLHFNVLLKSAF